MKSFLYFSAMAVLLFLISCKDFEPCIFTGIDSEKVLNMTNNNIEVELSVKIKNPNKFGFNIYPSDFDVKLGAVDVGKAILKNKVHIKANAEITYKFIVKTDMTKILAGGFASIFSMPQRANVQVFIKGELNAGTVFYRKKFPVNFTENITLH